MRRQHTSYWKTEAGDEASISVILDDRKEGKLISRLPITAQESYIVEGYFKGQKEYTIAHKQ